MIIYLLFYLLFTFTIPAFVLVVYPQIPASVPIIFNGIDVVNGYGPKTNLILLSVMPIIFSFIGVLLYLRTVIKKKKKTEKKYMMIFSMSMVIVQDFVISILLFFALDDSPLDIDIINNKIILYIFIVLMIVIALYLPYCKQNSYIGVRTKWTLNNEDVWHKTNKNSGYLLLLTGCIMLLTNLIINSFILCLMIDFVIIILDATSMIIYSYVISKVNVKPYA